MAQIPQQTFVSFIHSFVRSFVRTNERTSFIHSFIHSFIRIYMYNLYMPSVTVLSFSNSFIHSGYLYSAPSRNLLRGALSPATAKEKCTGQSIFDYLMLNQACLRDACKKRDFSRPRAYV